MVKNFNAHKYTKCTDKEFVGISITRDADFNYYMDQTRMIKEIIKEAKLTGAKDERLPYPAGNDPGTGPLFPLLLRRIDEPSPSLNRPN